MVGENLYELLRERFPQDLSRIFLETGQGVSYSYRDLEEQTARYAACLAGLGLGRGDRVLAVMDKSPQALFLSLGCIRAGLIYLPLNPACRATEAQHVLSDARPRAVISSPLLYEQFLSLRPRPGGGQPVPRLETLDECGGGTFAEKSRAHSPGFDVAPSQGGDGAALFYTSGTTGRPKGAMLTHRNLAANLAALRDAWRWTPEDVLLHTLPLFHVHGLFIACFSALYAAAKMIFLSRFDPAATVGCLSRSTVFMGVPTYYTRLLDQPHLRRESCGNMRLFISGSAPLLDRTFAAFEQRTGFAILERYGMTETGVIASNPVEGARLPGHVGKPLAGVAVRLTDDRGNVSAPGAVGEVQVSGESVFPGYWRQPEETAAAFTSDGFFRTGDLGQWAPNGYLRLVGRSKDLVITGGLNVYSKEVEAVMDQFEGIAESAVIGVPHPDFGEAVVAVVVRTKGATPLTEEAILAQLKQVLANYKIPKRVIFVEELPRNAMGKVQKNLLRALPQLAETFPPI